MSFSLRRETDAWQQVAIGVPNAMYPAVVNASFSVNSALVGVFGGGKPREFRVGKGAPLSGLEVAWEA